MQSPLEDKGKVVLITIPKVKVSWEGGEVVKINIFWEAKPKKCELFIYNKDFLDTSKKFPFPFSIYYLKDTLLLF